MGERLKTKDDKAPAKATKPKSSTATEVVEEEIAPSMGEYLKQQEELATNPPKGPFLHPLALFFSFSAGVIAVGKSPTLLPAPTIVIRDSPSAKKQPKSTSDLLTEYSKYLFPVQEWDAIVAAEKAVPLSPSLRLSHLTVP